MYVFIYIYSNKCTYLYLHNFIYIYVYIYLCLYLYICMCVYIYLYKYTCILIKCDRGDGRRGNVHETFTKLEELKKLKKKKKVKSKNQCGRQCVWLEPIICTGNSVQQRHREKVTLIPLRLHLSHGLSHLLSQSHTQRKLHIFSPIFSAWIQSLSVSLSVARHRNVPVLLLWAYVKSRCSDIAAK